MCSTVDSLLEDRVAITDAVAMEVLAGARDERHLTQLRGLLARVLIAAVAIRHEGTVLHADHDFEVIARHTALRVHPESIR